MKKYIGKKLVEAEPMTAEEAVKKNYRVNDHKGDGYKVTYEDGYKSWSPKEVFDKAYKVADTYLDRMNIEQDELNEKYDKIDDFISSDDFKDTVKDKYSQLLLCLQRDAMGSYLGILDNRIEKENGAKVECDSYYDFGDALTALKSGFSIRRRGWKGKGMFIIKQVPTLINGTIVPKMQSLPQSAKDRIMKKKGFINYKSQCLIYDEDTGTADSWAPSISDIFAEDWEILIEK